MRPTADFGDVFSLRYLRDVPARHDVALTYKVAGVDQKAGERVLREGAQHLDMSHQGVVGGVTQPLLSSRYRVFHITVHFAIGVSMTGLGDAKHLVQWRRGAAEANESVDVQGDGADQTGAVGGGGALGADGGAAGAEAGDTGWTHEERATAPACARRAGVPGGREDSAGP